MSLLMIDTDVLIDFLRGLEQAKNFIDSLPEQVFISAITVAELHVGVRNGKERAALTEFLDTLEATFHSMLNWPPKAVCSGAITAKVMALV